MPTITDGLFDGPIRAPMPERDRFPGAQGTHQTTERLASGNLPDQPDGLPVKPLDGDGPVPWSGLRSGR